MKETTMQKMTLAAVTAAVLGAVVLTGCADTDDHDCYPAPSYIYVVGGVYHYGSPTGTVIPRKYVDPKKGTLKKGVTVTPKGKVNVTKPSTGGGNNKGNGSVTKPGGTGAEGTGPRAASGAEGPLNLRLGTVAVILDTWITATVLFLGVTSLPAGMDCAKGTMPSSARGRN